ncbi:RGG repeats nuclear RNA binding protein A-like [Zingiber officinale]|uniref:RGG repeats nuclear RNA binding protein A-like n=1 Tax=Zingiber officinale TaxID=94328 RepID=UPI001C4AC5AA|nr:RGG repeats nuclear RNA binding protein A-like [Zingiber officinale]
MATANPFDILGDNDNDDPSQLVVVVQQQKVVAKKPAAPAATAPAAAKLPTKPAPPAQAVREAREARSNTAPARGGAGRGGPGRGRGGGRGPSREFGNENLNGLSRSYGGGGGGVGEDRDADKPDRERPPRQPFSGGRRGGYAGRGGYGNDESGGDSERPPRRVYERRSGTGRSFEVKRQGAGRGNWGTVADETLEQEKDDALKSEDKLPTEGRPEQENAPLTEESKDKEAAVNETEEKEEDKEMTLEEYEKIKEEKRKALLALKAEERKVEIDKDLQSMQLLSTKKEVDPIFVKLGSDKDAGKKKENTDRDERSKKPLNMNEFFKTGEGKQYYSPGGRGRGRGRGDRAPSRGSYSGGGSSFPAAAPSIEDPGQFPTLGGK